ncbi:jerky protein homolog-like [Bactrocera neohumeralis]|uniref:jerky protein homolog-like n=1 Tax=Bactrocera neohumeralis TaxID=98809 RepID=UPI00216598C5|nr:jerky protein homolog-like [Bactrocera neohumeralis]
MSKRKRVVLSLNDKVKIIKSIKNGESGSKLAQIYGVGTSTISDIKKNSDAIMKFTCALEKEDGSSQRKVMKKSQNEILENAVYTWFLQKRACGQPISGPLLCEKALDFNQKLGGDNSFKASCGWLARFKSRHGIRELEIQGKKLSANVASANSFVDELKEFLDEKEYDFDFVYNADETGLNWKALPSRSLASHRENAAPGHKVSKDRVTVMVCANANGTHRLPLLLIGKSKNPRCFKNVKIPLTYANQKKAWMNTDIFITWYENTFIPEVKKFQKDVGKEGDVLLLLDNAPTHPSAETLNRENGKFTVKFLPPNVTSILQPMDQSIIETLKRLYRKQLLRRLLTTEDSEIETTLKFFKETNLKDCYYMLVEAWNSVEMQTLKRAWNKLLKLTLSNSSIKPHDDFKEITEAMKILSIGEGCDEENIKEWLNCDNEDPGFQILTDEEIIEDLNNNEREDEEDTETGEVCQVPSHAEAFEALDIDFKWFERQDVSDPIQLLQLKRIRDLAAMKRNDSLRQRSITSYFQPKF